MTNAYPELRTEPYERTSVPMPDVITYLQDAAFPVEVKRSTYIVFRIESANGQSGVNNNYSGMQADGARWPDSLTHYFTGTTTATEGGTGRRRIFLCFDSWHDSVACLADRLAARGLYVGGTTHLVTQMNVTSATVLAQAYTKEWVTGSATAEASAASIGNFLSMYAQAAAHFHVSAAPTTNTPPIPTVPAILPAVPPATPTPTSEVIAENAQLRYALVDISARAQAVLASMPTRSLMPPHLDTNTDGHQS
jgi:hypothetical protein